MLRPEKKQISDQINESVKRYQTGDPYALDDIYGHLSTFCLRVIAKTCGKYVNSDDEEAAIIPNVVLDVLEKYDLSRGSFIVYLGQAVRNRTIDRMRKDQRNRIVPCANLNENFMLTSSDEVFFENIIDDIARKQEIERFAELLADFDVSFEQLAKISPRQPKTREQSQRVAWLIAANNDLSAYLVRKRMLPNRLLEEQFQINRGILDRYRKYIIAVVLIIMYDLNYLKPYVLPAQREDLGSGNEK